MSTVGEPAGAAPVLPIDRRLLTNTDVPYLPLPAKGSKVYLDEPGGFGVSVRAYGQRLS